GMPAYQSVFNPPGGTLAQGRATPPFAPLPPPPKRLSKPLLLVLTAALVALVGGGAFLALNNGWGTHASGHPVGANQSPTLATNPNQSPTSTTNPNPVKIGISLSLAGDFSLDGRALQQGYQLWADTINRNGGLLGRQVQLDSIDDSSDPNQVV